MVEVGFHVRLPEEVRQEMEQLAKEHDRTLNGEVVQACKIWIEVEKAKVKAKMEPETDTLFSQGKRYPWIVSYEGQRVATVLADTGGHACDYICQTRWLSRLKISAVSMDAELV